MFESPSVGGVGEATICIHGDGKHAVEFAKRIHETLLNEKIKIQPVN